jgi:hypothetical protein
MVLTPLVFPALTISKIAGKEEIELMSFQKTRQNYNFHMFG